MVASAANLVISLLRRHLLDVEPPRYPSGLNMGLICG